jgi:hypothetical protein
MKKTRTEYILEIEEEIVNIEVNEEYPTDLKISIIQERRRTKEEFIRLYGGIIKKLESFKP